MCSLVVRGRIYFLTLTGVNEHLNPTLLDSITAHVHRIPSEITVPTALITTAHGTSFFSDGYDLAMSKKLRLLIEMLISLPMPTIAAVTGHAWGAGFILAQAHDYVMMRKDGGYLALCEMDNKRVVPDWFVKVLKCKIGHPSVLRDVILRCDKVTADVAVAKGIIYSAHSSAEETVKAAVGLAQELMRRNWDGCVYACNRKVLFADVLPSLEFEKDPSKPLPTAADDEKKELAADPLGAIAPSLSHYLAVAIDALKNIQKIVDQKA